MMLREGQFINATIKHLLQFFNIHATFLQQDDTVYQNNLAKFLGQNLQERDISFTPFGKSNTLGKNTSGYNIVTEMLNVYPDITGYPEDNKLDNDFLEDGNVEPDKSHYAAALKKGKKTAFVMICAVRREQKNIFQTLYALYYASQVSSAASTIKQPLGVSSGGSIRKRAARVTLPKNSRQRKSRPK